jgi:hypothetical protein
MSGFLNRWSRRKSGESLRPKLADDRSIENSVETVEKASDIEPVPVPASLEDVERIDRFAPDFSAFMQPDVDPLVQQAALKKMFSDPHFNVMDGLDIYIDDYSKSDPIPLEMLKRMVQSDMLNIFRKNDGSPPDEDEPHTVSSPVPEATEKTLPLLDQADSRPKDLGAGLNIDTLGPAMADKKTS